MTTRLGARTSVTLTATDVTEGKGSNLGARHIDANGYEWIFAQAGADITQYMCVHVNSSYKANMVTAALSKTAGELGFAQVAFTSGEFGWVLIKGKGTIRVAASCADDVPLYTTDTAGVLDDATASLSHFQVQGVFADDSASAGGAQSCVAYLATYPLVKRPIGS